MGGEELGDAQGEETNFNLNIYYVHIHTCVYEITVKEEVMHLKENLEVICVGLEGGKGRDKCGN